MGFARRIAELYQVKVNALLDRAEDPREMLTQGADGMAHQQTGRQTWWRCLMMSTAGQWSVALSVHEHEGQTEAEALLDLGDDAHLLGHGTARRNPSDPNVTEIGEKIAVARALSDLAHMLLDSAATQLEDITHQQARLHL